MSDYIKFADGSIISIEYGASLSNIVHHEESEMAAIEVANNVTEDNVAHLEFYSNVEDSASIESGDVNPTGVYDDLAIINVYVDVPNCDVVISLREKSDIELRIAAIEEEQEEQNEAIDFLAMME